MDEWQSFLESVPWFLEPDEVVVPGSTSGPGTWRPCSREFVEIFPKLARLLTQASVTPVRVGARSLQLFCWTFGDESSFWLTESPRKRPPEHLWRDHKLLLASFGGIVERAGEPPSWLMNHTDALTASEARHDASFLKDYAWAFPNEAVPIDTALYYSVAREANGNTTLCHRQTGEILLFASDHSFKHVRPWNGMPEYTLYTLDGAPDFRSYVETVAAQWLADEDQS